MTASLTFVSPPTSSQVTLGILGAPMASAKFLRAASTAMSKSHFVRQREASPPASSTSRAFARRAWLELSEIAAEARCSSRSRLAMMARLTTSSRSPATRAAVLRAMEDNSTSDASGRGKVWVMLRNKPSRSFSSGADISSSCVKRLRIFSDILSTLVAVATSTLDLAITSRTVATILSALSTSICLIVRTVY